MKYIDIKKGEIKASEIGLDRMRIHCVSAQEVSKLVNNVIAIKWILRHDAKIQTISGTINVNRLKDICKAAKVTLGRQEWYEICRAVGITLP